MGSELLALLEQEAGAERERLLAEARGQADEIRAAAGARYTRVLEHLIAEGAQSFTGQFAVEAHPDDVETVRTAVQQRRLDAEVRPAESVRGGVRLVSSDGRYMVLNTLTSRLERARPTLASDVARTLWG